jgi:hypothetical protein
MVIGDSALSGEHQGVGERGDTFLPRVMVKVLGSQK